MGIRVANVSLLVALVTATGCSMMGQSTESGVKQQASWNSPDAAQSNAAFNKQNTFVSAADQRDVKNLWAMARLSERRGQVDQARGIYEAILARDPDDARPYHRLAVMYSQKSNWSEAERCFERALQLSSADAELMGDAGYFYYLRADNERAERYLRNATELEPGNAKYSNNLAILLGEMGRDEECLALFRRNAREADALANLGFVLAQRGDYRQAALSYSHALTLDDSLQPAAEAMVQLAQYVPEDQRPTAYMPAERTTTALDIRLSKKDSSREIPTRPAVDRRESTRGPEVYDVARDVPPTDYVSLPSTNDQVPSNAGQTSSDSTGFLTHVRTADANAGYQKCQPAMPQFPVQPTFYASPNDIMNLPAYESFQQ